MIAPSLAEMPLKPVTAISREIITSAIQAGTLPRGISINKAAVIRSLSARGSRAFPRNVTASYRRAINPSKRSVMAAMEKRIVAKKAAHFPGKNRKITIKGMTNILRMVRKFGTFNIGDISYKKRYFLYWSKYLSTILTNFCVES